MLLFKILKTRVRGKSTKLLHDGVPVITPRRTTGGISLRFEIGPYYVMLTAEEIRDAHKMCLAGSGVNSPLVTPL